MSSTRLCPRAFCFTVALLMISQLVAVTILPADAAKKSKQLYRSRGLSSQDAMLDMIQLLNQARANAHSPIQSWTVLEPAPGVYNPSFRKTIIDLVLDTRNSGTSRS